MASGGAATLSRHSSSHRERCRFRRIARHVLFSCLAGGAWGGQLARASTWTNGTGDGLWNTDANWLEGVRPGGASSAMFPSPGPADAHVVTLVNSPAGIVEAMTFDDNYSLSS